jgi:hypothetical protein
VGNTLQGTPRMVPNGCPKQGILSKRARAPIETGLGTKSCRKLQNRAYPREQGSIFSGASLGPKFRKLLYTSPKAPPPKVLPMASANKFLHFLL